MNGRKTGRKLISFILSLVMIIGMVPMSAAAAPATDDNSTSANVSKVLSYAAQMREENRKGDYTQGKFTWDTEGKKDSWRYFNGLMMDAFLMTGDERNVAYAEAFYDSNIAEDGTLNTKYYEGELDSIEAARGLFDLLDSENTKKYQLAIQYIYTQLEKQTTYEKCGGNYLHKQEDDGTPTSSWSDWNIGLDGLYMAEPFLMECANAIEEGKLELTGKDGEAVSSTSIYEAVYNRFKWVAENMRDAETGLYHHGWSVDRNEGNDHFWARGIGWYAMAQADIIEMMPEGEYRSAMIAQLPTFFDSMLKYQDADSGMWYNVVNRGSDLSGNRLETSGSAMMAYALMKAYNNGYVSDAKYGEAGLAAFNGIVQNKIQGSEGDYKVVDIYQKSGVGTSDEYYCTNPYTDDEAKGTGALIMAATLANATAVALPDTPDSGEGDTSEPVKDDVTGISVSGTSATGITVADKSNDATVRAALANKLEGGFKAYDISLEGYTNGTEATVTMPAPAGANKVYYVSDDGSTVEEITGAKFENETVTFTTDHFSIYASGVERTGGNEPETPAESVTASGYLQGETQYELDTDGVDDGAEYLILNSRNNGNRYAFRNNNSNRARQSVTVSGSVAEISNNESSCVWTFTETSDRWNISNGSEYLRLNNEDIIGNGATDLTVNNRGSGAYRISQTVPNGWGSTDYYLRYRKDNWQRYYWSGDIYLYQKVSNQGARVDFSVAPGAVSLMTGESQMLTPSVLVSGTAADNYSITWSSENSGIASVDENGNVTAVAGGTTNITATLTSANDTSMYENLSVTVPVTVADKAVSSATLSGNTVRYTTQNSEPDFTGIVLHVTYEDGSTADITIDSGLVISDYDVTRIGTQYATISYLGIEYGKVTVIVEGDPYEGLTPADPAERPEYPDDGAVRIDKKATADSQTFGENGVGQVELDVAGISVHKGVDVVLVVDVSNSMGWSLENSHNTGDINKMPDDGQTSKLQNAMTAAGTFADVLLDGNNGSENDNTLSFVTFAGYDSKHSNDEDDQHKYVDSVMTVFSGIKDADTAKTSFNGTTITGKPRHNTPEDDGVDYTLTVTNADDQQVSGTNRGNTNYDYAFYEAQQAVEEIQRNNYAESGRETYVIFMTDGAPSHYNRENVQGGSNRDYYPDSNTQTYTQKTSDTASWTEYLTNTDNRYANDLYSAVGGNFYAIGFDLANGGFGDYSWSDNPEALEQVLAGMVTDAEIPVMSTDDSQELTDFYDRLAHQISYAGTNAKVTDIIHSDYTLQMSTTSGTGDTTGTVNPAPSIDVMAYDLYTESGNGHEAGERIPNSSEILERVTFNSEGTEAYSTALEGNRMTTAEDGTITISAQYFTYTKTPDGTERFVWTIGNITDQEVALIYDVYLKNTMEGTREDGVYDTNESAVLEYVDINGNYDSIDFPVPALGWGGATTSYEYYLVNADGQPVNHAGDVVSFPNRIIIAGPDTISLNLNADATIDAQTVYAEEHLPDGYFLYDPYASYTVQTSSGAVEAGITCSEPSEAASGINPEDPNRLQQSGDQTTIVVDAEDTYYTWSRVAFGVRYDLTPSYVDTPLNKDQIVIDYGKAVQVDVLANDEETIPEGYTAELVGLATYNANINTSQRMASPGSTEIATNNGTYTVTDDKKVQFQLSRFLSEVDEVFAVVKLTNKENTDNYYYLYQELDVIPATAMYYEDNFSNVITYAGTENTKWDIYNSNTSDSPDYQQDDGTVGQNSPYGYDSSYESDVAYSNASAHHIYASANSDGGYDITYAQFTFTGTGFDLISVTEQQAAMVRAEIYQGSTAEGDVYKSQQVSNVGGTNALYQIPVLSCEDMPYGTYTVRVQVYKEYTNTQIPALNRGGQFIFDAIRIYDPIDVSGSDLTGDAAIAQAAYTADTEAYEQHLELRDAIVNSADYDSTTEDTETDGVLYIDATPGHATTSSSAATVVDYTAAGPNNETYLMSQDLEDSAVIGFILNVESIPETLQIGAKSVLGGDVVLDVSLENPESSDTAYMSETFSQATAQNYSTFVAYASDADETGTEVTDLTPYFAETENGYQAYVYVANCGDNTKQILSITDIKATFSTASAMSFTYSTDVVNTLNGRLASEETPAQPGSEAQLISADFTEDSIRYTKQAELLVETTADVEEIVVLKENGNEQSATTKVTTDDEGNKVWTLKFKPGKAGTYTYTVYGLDKDGAQTESASVSIETTRR